MSDRGLGAVAAIGLVVAAALGCRDGVSAECSHVRPIAAVLQADGPAATVTCKAAAIPLLAQIEPGPSTRGWTRYQWSADGSVESRDAATSTLRFLELSQLFATAPLGDPGPGAPGGGSTGLLTLQMILSRDLADGLHRFEDVCGTAADCSAPRPPQITATFSPVGFGPPLRLLAKSGALTLRRSRDLPFVDIAPDRLVQGRAYTSTLAVQDLRIEGEMATADCGEGPVRIGPLSLTVTVQTMPSTCRDPGPWAH